MRRWVIHSRAAFEARHGLISYQGRPEAPHNHHWQIEIRVGTDRLNAEGYAIDFHAVHRLLAETLSPLDGADLNHHPEIGLPTPSAERLAEVLASWLQQPLAAMGGTLLSVSVWEGPDNRVDLLLDDER